MVIRNSDIANTASELIETSTRSASINDMSSSSRSLAVKITAENIPGAELQEPLERHGILALQWWLLCSSIKIPSTCRKSQLIYR